MRQYLLVDKSPVMLKSVRIYPGGQEQEIGDDDAEGITTAEVVVEQLAAKTATVPFTVPARPHPMHVLRVCVANSGAAHAVHCRLGAFVPVNIE
jgi:hypothetical protein